MKKKDLVEMKRLRREIGPVWQVARWLNVGQSSLVHWERGSRAYPVWVFLAIQVAHHKGVTFPRSSGRPWCGKPHESKK